MRLGTCSKYPSQFLRSCVHSVSKKTFKNLSVNLLGFRGATQKKWPEGCNLLQLVQNFLKHSCFLLDVNKKLQFLHTCPHWQTSLPFTLRIKPFSASGPIYRPPLCLRKMREGDVSAHFFQALH